MSGCLWHGLWDACGTAQGSPKDAHRTSARIKWPFEKFQKRRSRTTPHPKYPHHILLVGQPGTGKTVTIRGLLHIIRRRGDGAVIYDPTGELARVFNDPMRDLVISPLDAPEVTTVEGRFVFLTDDRSRGHHAHLIARVVDEAQSGKKVWLVLDELPYDLPVATITICLSARELGVEQAGFINLRPLHGFLSVYPRRGVNFGLATDVTLKV